MESSFDLASLHWTRAWRWCEVKWKVDFIECSLNSLFLFAAFDAALSARLVHDLLGQLARDRIVV